MDFETGRGTHADPGGVATRDDFARFVSAMLADFRASGEAEWENRTLERFLDGLSEVARARIADVGEQEQEQASWRLFAEIVGAASRYE